MPKFTVILTIDTTESAVAIIDADTPEEAKELALEEARRGKRLMWEADPYSGDYYDARATACDPF